MDKIRHIAGKVDQLLHMFPAVAVIGPRQCGKSTLVKQLRPDWKYYDLESPDDYQLITDDPIAFFTLNTDKVIIDEAQQYPDLFRVLRSVIDENRKLKGRFLLTGSSSPEIVKGITESLAGRIATVEMWPFKQTERFDQPLPDLYERILSGADGIEAFSDLSTSMTLAHSMQALLQGGFPEPVLESESNDLYQAQWMDNYIANYINRDIRGLFPKLNIHVYRRFLSLLAHHSGHQLNMSSMARALETTVPTIKEYLDIIHQTFLWRNVQPFSNNPLKKVQKSNKGFFRDTGVLHHLLKINQLDALLVHPVAGFSFESFVTEELIRGFQSTMATQLEYSYYRTVDKSEVDFVIEGTFGVIPIEVKLNTVVKRQALRGLEGFISDVKCPYGIVINRGKRVEFLSERVVQIPVQYI
ncbi:ATP-binding protein [Leucothrix pacifica]|uniref:ATPase n=1 Tax=Leucothrix pacifica TaxID=1247513 RepID=A0A317C0C0_9GAMM|nr:ATP-binding protein [Leucothrix pacifica]PWQ92104.1 ATPase [Leucothrix pacifica]